MAGGVGSRIATNHADIILIGHGSGDALHLTVQAQQVLERFGFAFAIGVPPLLNRMLRSSGVEIEDLDDRMLNAEDPAESLLLAAEIVLKQVEVEQPVILLVPGNPLFLNSLSRFLVGEGAERGLTVQRLAGVSQLDVLINELGVDVARLGLQIFDSGSVASGRTRPDPTVPAVVFRLSAAFDEVIARLGRIYPARHAITLFNVDPESDESSFAGSPLGDAGQFRDHVHSGSSLFVGPLST